MALLLVSDEEGSKGTGAQSHMLWQIGWFGNLVTGR